MPNTKNISILGSTGSIGTQSLDIIERHPDRFRIIGLVAGSNIKVLLEQIKKFSPLLVSVAKKEDAQTLKETLGSSAPKILFGEEGAIEVAAHPDNHLIVSAIVGAAGLKPTMAALSLGKDVALANKESLVVAGPLMTNLAKAKNARFLPVDSEHNAIFQALGNNRPEDVKKIILTASGGPFFQRDANTFSKITVEEALKHPKWKMGPKISIDSATLMNKGLEVIEATWFFDVPVEKIDVVIHPQSLVHSLVEYVDGSQIAQLGVPDMRCAISYTLAYPERIVSGVPSLNLATAGSLTFFQPDFEKFPCLKLAFEAARLRQSMPAVMNAANEVAVDKFLNKLISFVDIPVLVEKVMAKHTLVSMDSLEQVLAVDAWARRQAMEIGA